MSRQTLPGQLSKRQILQENTNNKMLKLGKQTYLWTKIWIKPCMEDLVVGLPIPAGIGLQSVSVKLVKFVFSKLML